MALLPFCAMLKTLWDEPLAAGLSMHGTETGSPVHSDSGQVETGDLQCFLQCFHLQRLEVTVHQAILQLCLKMLETGKPLLFLHDVMQVVAVWKTIYSYMASMWKRPELPTYLFTMKTFSLAATIQWNSFFEILPKMGSLWPPWIQNKRTSGCCGGIK